MSAEDATTKQEQIPLKEGENAAENAEVVAPEEPKPKKNWFSWGKKKAADDVAEDNAEADLEAGGDAEKPPKKAAWWKRNCGNKGEKEQADENISIGIDLVNRDTNSINPHIQFGFEDIFGEADSQHSWDCVWRLNYRVFTWTRLFVYRLLSLVALPFTLLFAIFFALISVLNVFIFVPAAKLLSIPGNALAKIWNWLIHAIFDPIASAIGLVFSSFTIRKYGINQETTAPCV
ncbi:unnamed protein product [Caenorhabditis angaria]|uniref:Caveolin n=1 Tax=Caenorhabditis angaria TaxID=860376 RepID=A0A9P1N2X0_9PELO|nr:unnamed protein product [Caenorhabditis angaria]